MATASTERSPIVWEQLDEEAKNSAERDENFSNLYFQSNFNAIDDEVFG